MLKKFVLMLTCVGICTWALGCGGGGSGGGDDATAKKMVEDAAKTIQKKKAEREKQGTP